MLRATASPWWASVWPPNLSQFLPDLFNAGVTAALVAIIVWRLQVRRENTDARQRAVDDWDRLKVHLREALAVPVELYPATLMYSTPARTLRGFLEPYPVEEWARVLHKRPDVVGLASLEREWPRLAESQMRVHGLTPSAVRATIRSGQAQDAHIEGVIVTLVRARIAGEPLDPTALRTLIERGQSATDIESWVADAVRQPELAAAVATMKERFAVTRAAYDAVLAGLG